MKKFTMTCLELTIRQEKFMNKLKHTAHYILNATLCKWTKFFFAMLLDINLPLCPNAPQSRVTFCKYIYTPTAFLSFTDNSNQHCMYKILCGTSARKHTTSKGHLRETGLAAEGKTVGWYFQQGLVNRSGWTREKNCKTQQQKKKNHC